MNLSFYFELLNKISPVSEADFSLLAAHLKERSYKKNEVLVRPGEVQTFCYFMLEGVMMSYYDSGAKMHVQAFAYPPDLVAIPESFLKQTPSPHFLQCMNDVRVLELTHDKLQQALSQSHALEKVFRLMTEGVLIGILKRYTELNSMSIEERFRAFTKRSPHLLQLVPHKYIASYLNIDPTNFSKLYNVIKI